MKSKVTAAKRRRWQPIETAPRDGSELLLIATLYNRPEPRPRRVVGIYSGNPVSGRPGWYGCKGMLFHVTHWMPLPEMPKEEA